MHDQVVVSSRVRLARNVKGHPFPMWASDESLLEVGKVAEKCVKESPGLKGFKYVAVDQVDPLQRQVWSEARLVSPEFAQAEKVRFLALGPLDRTSIMVNEEDHLRIQALVTGFNLIEAWDLADRADNGLESELDFAFSERWGYLTACPTNVGTGMRASLMLHLPALVMTGQAHQLLGALTSVGIVVRGLFGEGSEAMGNLFQISNATSLGQSEPEILDHLKTIGTQVVDRELAARKGLLSQAKDRVADQAYRAFGILTNARMISFREALELISLVRLGAETGILTMSDADNLSTLWRMIGPAHLEMRAGRSIGADKEEAVRAETIRSLLADGTGK